MEAKVGDRVIGRRPQCKCKGGGMVTFDAIVLKVMANQRGTWYFLDNKATVESTMVEKVI